MPADDWNAEAAPSPWLLPQAHSRGGNPHPTPPGHIEILDSYTCFGLHACYLLCCLHCWPACMPAGMDCRKAGVVR